MSSDQENYDQDALYSDDSDDYKRESVLSTGHRDPLPMAAHRQSKRHSNLNHNKYHPNRQSLPDDVHQLLTKLQKQIHIKPTQSQLIDSEVFDEQHQKQHQLHDDLQPYQLNQQTTQNQFEHQPEGDEKKVGVSEIQIMEKSIDMEGTLVTIKTQNNSDIFDVMEMSQLKPKVHGYEDEQISNDDHENSSTVQVVALETQQEYPSVEQKQHEQQNQHELEERQAPLLNPQEERQQQQQQYVQSPYPDTQQLQQPYQQDNIYDIRQRSLSNNSSEQSYNRNNISGDYIPEQRTHLHGHSLGDEFQNNQNDQERNNEILESFMDRNEESRRKYTDEFNKSQSEQIQDGTLTIQDNDKDSIQMRRRESSDIGGEQSQKVMQEHEENQQPSFHRHHQQSNQKHINMKTNEQMIITNYDDRMESTHQETVQASQNAPQTRFQVSTTEQPHLSVNDLQKSKQQSSKSQQTAHQQNNLTSQEQYHLSNYQEHHETQSAKNINDESQSQHAEKYYHNDLHHQEMDEKHEECDSNNNDLQTQHYHATTNLYQSSLHQSEDTKEQQRQGQNFQSHHVDEEQHPFAQERPQKITEYQQSTHHQQHHQQTHVQQCHQPTHDQQHQQATIQPQHPQKEQLIANHQRLPEQVKQLETEMYKQLPALKVEQSKENQNTLHQQLAQQHHQQSQKQLKDHQSLSQQVAYETNQHQQYSTYQPYPSSQHQQTQQNSLENQLFQSDPHQNQTQYEDNYHQTPYQTTLSQHLQCQPEQHQHQPEPHQHQPAYPQNQDPFQSQNFEPKVIKGNYESFSIEPQDFPTSWRRQPQPQQHQQILPEVQLVSQQIQSQTQALYQQSVITEPQKNHQLQHQQEHESMMRQSHADQPRSEQEHQHHGDQKHIKHNNNDLVEQRKDTIEKGRMSDVKDKSETVKEELPQAVGQAIQELSQEINSLRNSPQQSSTSNQVQTHQKIQSTITQPINPITQIQNQPLYHENLLLDQSPKPKIQDLDESLKHNNQQKTKNELETSEYFVVDKNLSSLDIYGRSEYLQPQKTVPTIPQDNKDERNSIQQKNSQHQDLVSKQQSQGPSNPGAAAQVRKYLSESKDGLVNSVSNADLILSTSEVQASKKVKKEKAGSHHVSRQQDHGGCKCEIF